MGPHPIVYTIQTVLRCLRSNIFAYIALISIVRDRSNVIGKQLMNNEQSVGGDWMDGVDGISLDCYDFQSTCGAKKAILFTALSFV